MADPGADGDYSVIASNQRTVRRSHGNSHYAERGNVFDDIDYHIETDRNTSVINSEIIRALPESHMSVRRAVYITGGGIPAQNSRSSLFYSEHSANRRTY